MGIEQADTLGNPKYVWPHRGLLHMVIQIIALLLILIDLMTGKITIVDLLTCEDTKWGKHTGWPIFIPDKSTCKAD